MLSNDDSSTPLRAQNRACDRCRRRKAKCDATDTGLPCSTCRDAQQQCTFDVPLGKRGPKSRRNLPSHETGPPNQVFATNTSSRQSSPSWPLSAASTRSQQCSALQRWQELSAAVGASPSLLDVVRRALDRFFVYIYPLIPLVDELSLRGVLQCFIDGSSSGRQATNADFALLTATCAEVAFFIPPNLFPEGVNLGPLFLTASRDCLASYLEADLENPNAVSLAIRYFHSNCLHHSARSRLAWHAFGEATRIAHVMRLHDETSYQELPATEAELCRKGFWLLYQGDKSAATLINRPIAIHKHSFESGITANYPDIGGDDRLVGFIACIRLWRCASDLLLEIRLISDRRFHQDGSGMLSAGDRVRLNHLHIDFATCLDDLPENWQPELLKVFQDQSPSQWASLTQVANLQVTYHCLRLVIAQKLEELGYFNEHPDTMALRKTEIARDFLRIIRDAPLWSLQVNGEPCVEKIRLVGANMLAAIHTNESLPLAARARRDFLVLLDILTRLDSKASDALRAGSLQDFQSSKSS